MNIKSIIYTGVFIFSTAFISCEVNDLTPLTALSEETAFQTPERIELTVSGVYDGGQSGFYAGGAVRGYPFGAAHLEQGDMRGEDMVSIAAFFQITYQNTYDANTPNNGFFWQSTYAMINRSNVVIDGIRNAAISKVITQAKADEYEAECRFLRALGHLYLLNHFARPFNDNPTAANGGVPYRVDASTGSSTVDKNIQQGRNTVTECYAKILEDLNYAEEKLPATRATNKLTRAAKGTVIALKTRVYLHQNNWASVVSEGNKLVPTAAPFKSPIGAFELTSTPIGPFGAGNKTNTESIFSFENNDVDNAGVNGAGASMYGSVGTGGRGLVAISPILWNQTFFPADDARKGATMVVQDGATSAGRGAYFTRKYSDPINRTDNAPIIRYAEVLLNLAEGIARSTNSVDARAVELLNAVRNRSVPVGTGRYTAASFATADDLIKAILNERRIEFIGEGMRWLDIHRLGKDAKFGLGGIPSKVSNATTNYSPLYTNLPTTTFTAQAAVPYSDYRFIWPIPIEEILNNPVIAKQQNPGY